MQEKKQNPAKQRKQTAPEGMCSLGYITQAHGLRGEVRIHLHNPNGETILDVETVTIQSPQHPRQTLHIQYVRDHNKGYLVKFKEANNRNDAEALKRCELFVPTSDFPELDEDEFYFYQLAELPVFSTTGEEIGHVKRVLPGPSYPILVVAYKKREVFVPVVESIVPTIDVEQKRIEVEMLPGLFDDEE